MMRRTEVRDVPDQFDQDVAQVLHRVAVTRITIERADGGYTLFEKIPSDDDGQDLSCPDCGYKVYWSEDQKDYRHVDPLEAQRCWLNRNHPEGAG